MKAGQTSGGLGSLKRPGPDQCPPKSNGARKGPLLNSKNGVYL